MLLTIGQVPAAPLLLDGLSGRHDPAAPLRRACAAAAERLAGQPAIRWWVVGTGSRTARLPSTTPWSPGPFLGTGLPVGAQEPETLPGPGTRSIPELTRSVLPPASPRTGPDVRSGVEPEVGQLPAPLAIGRQLLLAAGLPVERLGLLAVAADEPVESARRLGAALVTGESPVVLLLVADEWSPANWRDVVAGALQESDGPRGEPQLDYDQAPFGPRYLVYTQQYRGAEAVRGQRTGYADASVPLVVPTPLAVPIPPVPIPPADT